MFADRSEAGKRLAEKLAPYKGKNAVVLGLPRGGVVTGYEISRFLSLPFDIVAVRKVGHPLSPEYAIGAVDEHGSCLLNDAEAATVDQKWLAEEIGREVAEAKRRGTAYREGRPPIQPAGKIAIIADDGIATGLTMRLALRSVKAQEPEKIIVAVPVAPLEALRALKAEGADETIVLEPPEKFAGAVGAHYVRFGQVENGEVISMLQSLYGTKSTHSG